MTIAMLGVAFGVVFWGWGKLYAIVDVGVKLGFPPAAGLMGGGWLIAGVVAGLVVRKPGAALIAEVIAASVSALMPGNEWGTAVLVSGALQGLGAELIFAVVGYRVYAPVVAILAGMLAGVFEALYEWQAWYSDWGLDYRVVHLGFFMVSGAVIAGFGGWLLVRALARAGALDAFEAGRDEVVKV